jgi:hypothetical protein
MIAAGAGKRNCLEVLLTAGGDIEAVDNHQLQGMVVTTKINPDDVVDEPEFIIKDFAEIGTTKF